MTMTRWTMREIITVHWDGRLPEGKIRILTITIKSRRFFPPARELPFTEKKSSTGSEILMKSILPIWRIWISVIAPGSLGIRTGMLQRRKFICVLRPQLLRQELCREHPGRQPGQTSPDRGASCAWQRGRDARGRRKPAEWRRTCLP